ncbi:uncharacterized protein LOC118489746 isoform X1 [Helianthus annuus]|uniref:uncharacterized protein LOC118489746 isoform X1 n=1 Tax=Helianthus annuus TaxID=4232 RepID=UPI001652F868|nr:uncharacterized protein LOC118489746 isoform X1 [Helianthus annuus]
MAVPKSLKGDGKSGQQGSLKAAEVQDHIMGVVEVADANQPPSFMLGNIMQPIAAGNTSGRISQGSVWDRKPSGPLSYGQMMKRHKEENDVKMEYFPPTVTPEGNTRIFISQDDLLVSAQVYPLHLYGYFLGTSMDFRVVDRCLRRLWRLCDLDEVTKSPVGIFYFKFKSEKGLNDVLENGSWMVNNIPIFLDKWIPGLSLEKVESSTVPLWVTTHNIPLDLWTSTGTNKLMSGMQGLKRRSEARLEAYASGEALKNRN